MAARKKPDFARKFQFKVSATFLPDEVRYWLVMHAAKSGLNPAQQEKLIAHANQLAQMPSVSEVPIATERDEIAKVASEARRLLASLHALSESTVATLAIHSREACIERPCPMPIDIVERLIGPESIDLLDEAWEWVSALEGAAEYAQSQLKPSKQAKPQQSRARGLVASLAMSYRRMTNEDPPKDPASWFAEFSKCLGGHLGLDVGPRIVVSGIELANAPFFSDEEREKLRADNEAAASRAREVNCAHDWPLPVSFPEPQNCRKCGAGRNGAPDRQ